MKILSKEEILKQELGENYKTSQVFLAEKIIIRYIGKKPDDWDETLSMATTMLVSRLSMDSGIKSESTNGHSITYADMSDLRNLLGASLLAILDKYKEVPVDTGMGQFYGMI